MEKFSITNPRNLELSGFIHWPSEVKPTPAVILLHGFKGYQDEKNIVSLAEELAVSGIAAIRFDASGFGSSEGDLERDYRFSHYLNDLDCVFRFLHSQSRIDPHLIGLWGHSMGAMLALIYSSRHPEIKAICAISPAVAMAEADLLKNQLVKWKQQGYLKLPSSRYGEVTIPNSFIEDAMRYNVLDSIKSVQAPKLIIWGSADQTVSPSSTRKIFKEALLPKESFMIKGMDHFYKKNDNFLKIVNQKVSTFFINHLQ